MALGVVEEQYLKDIANAIKLKLANFYGLTEEDVLDVTYQPDEMAGVIREYLKNPQGSVDISGKDLSSYYDYGYINIDVSDYEWAGFRRDSVGLVPENIISGKSVLGVSGTAVPGPDTCTVLVRCNLTEGSIQMRWVNSDWSGYSYYQIAAGQTMEIVVGGNSILCIASTHQSMGSPSMDNCNNITAKYSYEWSQAFHCGAGGSGTIWIQRG